MKKILFSLLIIISVVLTGCEITYKEKEPAKKEDKKEEKKLYANRKIGGVYYYVPLDFTYHPELRGLIYDEDSRKIFIKGDVNDRSEAVIIDAIIEGKYDDFDAHIKDLNDKIKDGTKYVLVKENPKIYGREKFKGKSGETTIYNYTYLAYYNGYLYSITVSGPESKESELNTLKTNILDIIKVGN